MIKNCFRPICTLVVLSLVSVALNAQGPDTATDSAKPLANAHAHNDYEHDRPLLDALDEGFTSIEADVFLVEGQLLVAPKTWAATLAHRRAIDRVRSEQASRVRQDRDANQTIRNERDVVAAEVESSFDKVRVRRALLQLSELQREAVELAYFGGHTYREVAVLLDVAEGTVKSRIRDGMIRLRDELGGES